MINYEWMFRCKSRFFEWGRTANNLCATLLHRPSCLSQEKVWEKSQPNGAAAHCRAIIYIPDEAQKPWGLCWWLCQRNNKALRLRSASCRSGDLIACKKTTFICLANPSLCVHSRLAVETSDTRVIRPLVARSAREFSGAIVFNSIVLLACVHSSFSNMH